MRSIYGQRAIEAVVSLTQPPDGLTLSELSAAVGAPLSSAQRAIATLVKDGLVNARGIGPRKRYELDRLHPATDALVEFSLRVMPPQRTLDLLCRANSAVQFAGRDHDGYLVVLSPFSDPADVARLSSAIGTVNESRPDPTSVEIVERQDIRERLFESSQLRDRGLRLAPVKGSAARVFRDPYRQGSDDAPKLGRLHPSLSRPSQGVLRRMAQEYAVARITAFGSSVRADFRPDSDVDLLVEPSPGSRLGIHKSNAIQRELEALLDRDVDLVNARYVRPDVRLQAENEGVVLYGRS